MYDKNKDTKSFTEPRNYLLNFCFLTVLARARFITQSKSLWWSFIAKIIYQWLLQRGLFLIQKAINVAGRVRQVVVLYCNDCKEISNAQLPRTPQNPQLHHYLNSSSETQTYVFPIFGKLNSLNSAVYLLICQYFEMEKKLSRRKVGLHSADFSWFELRRCAMKENSEGNAQYIFSIVHWSNSAHMFLVQALG